MGWWDRERGLFWHLMGTLLVSVVFITAGVVWGDWNEKDPVTVMNTFWLSSQIMPLVMTVLGTFVLAQPFPGEPFGVKAAKIAEVSLVIRLCASMIYGFGVIFFGVFSWVVTEHMMPSLGIKAGVFTMPWALVMMAVIAVTPHVSSYVVAKIFYK